MKLAPLPILIGAVCSSARVVLPAPDWDGGQHHQSSVDGPHQHDTSENNGHPLSSWWDTARPLFRSVAPVLDESVDYLTSSVHSTVQGADGLQQEIRQQLDSAVALAQNRASDRDRHDFPDLTLYQIISLSDHAKKFAKLIDEHQGLVDLLNSTDANHTLFAPLDEAFEDLPDDQEISEDLLKYHIGLGDYPVHRILTTNTLPTVLNEALLGDEPQRLRTSVGLSGVHVNFYSRVVAADIGTKNGVIHGIRNVLVPPPFLGRILTLYPGEFSTLLLAYEKTDFVKYIHKIRMLGSTIFAPSNRAFSSLDPRVTAFLFNTDEGLKYLKALLKYQIAPNATLYSDAFYDKTQGSANAEGWKREHFDLETLLDGAHVGVDIASVAGFRVFRVNGFANVPIRDAPGKNGVIQVVDKVLIPPCKHGHGHDLASINDLTVEGLKQCLDSHVGSTLAEFEL